MWAELVGSVATSELNGDVMIEILTRLPIRSLLRFKSVCKAWYSLFSNRVFIKSHVDVTRATASENNSLSLLVRIHEKDNFDHILRLSFQPLYSDPVTTYLQPFFDAMDPYSIVGSINGLICLNLCTVATSIVLWNPAIRKHFQIQYPQFTLRHDERVSLGFAYCSKSDDYKVIRVIYPKRFTALLAPSRVEIYGTKANSWRTLEEVNLPWLFYQGTCRVVANGVPYWHAYELIGDGPTLRELIMWFDVTHESFRFYQLPCFREHYKSEVRMQLGVMEENPAIIVVHSGRADFWLLDDHGVNGNEVSWKKKFSAELISGVERVIGLWKNGKVIGEDGNGGVVLFDPAPKIIKDIPILGSWGFLEAYGYTESLIFPTIHA